MAGRSLVWSRTWFVSRATPTPPTRLLMAATMPALVNRTVDRRGLEPSIARASAASSSVLCQVGKWYGASGVSWR
jgi:hypothetical protein